MAELVEAERERKDGEKEGRGDLFRKAERSGRILILCGELYRRSKSMMEKPVLVIQTFRALGMQQGKNGLATTRMPEMMSYRSLTSL